MKKTESLRTRLVFLSALVRPCLSTSHNGCNASTFQSVLPYGSEGVVESVHLVAKGGEYGEGLANVAYPVNPTNLPELCAVTVRMSSSAVSSYRFGLFLPSEWNGRFLAVGNGGFAGGINWLDMGPGAHYGFATVSTDTGHNSTSADLAWAENSPQKRADWGWRSLHGTATWGKMLASQYYGSSARYSYYSGCSTGGRQGLKEAQVFPDTFDGVLVGAPAWDSKYLNTYVTRVGLYNLPVDDPGHINYTRFPALAQEVVRQCDGLDGLADGIVSDPSRCTLDYSTMSCGSPGAKLDGSACFTEAQIGVMRKVYGDCQADNGSFIYPGLTTSSEDQWYILLGSDAPTPFGVGYQQYFLYDDPDWTWRNWSDQVFWDAARQDPGMATADDYDLGPFRDEGGKVLLYHGLADGLVPTKGSIMYHDRVVEAMGSNRTAVQDFFRLFLVPGMQHCWATPVDAPWYFAGAFQAGSVGNDTWSVPGFEDPEHDALLALMGWVENGTEVGSIVATTWRSSMDPTSGVLRQRPICPHPRQAVWDRRGDVDEASSWSCEEASSGDRPPENTAVSSRSAAMSIMILALTVSLCI